MLGRNTNERQGRHCTAHSAHAVLSKALLQVGTALDRQLHVEEGFRPCRLEVDIQTPGRCRHFALQHINQSDSTFEAVQYVRTPDRLPGPGFPPLRRAISCLTSNSACVKAPSGLHHASNLVDRLLPPQRPSRPSRQQALRLRTCSSWPMHRSSTVPFIFSSRWSVRTRSSSCRSCC